MASSMKSAHKKDKKAPLASISSFVVLPSGDEAVLKDYVGRVGPVAVCGGLWSQVWATNSFSGICNPSLYIMSCRLVYVEQTRGLSTMARESWIYPTAAPL